MAALSRTNPAVKRLLSELRGLDRNPSDEFHAHPLSDENVFEWHFTIRGPPDSDFEGGLYHGRILIPADYPFKAPDIVLLTPSGRFELNKKICLSNSSYHPESWQPAWGIRTVLLALRAFFPSDPEGAIGGIKLPPRERKHLARISRRWKCPTCHDELAKVLPPRSPPAPDTPHTPAASAAPAAEDPAPEPPSLLTELSDGAPEPQSAEQSRAAREIPSAGANPAAAAAAPDPTAAAGPPARTSSVSMASQDHVLTNITVLSFVIILVILFRKSFVPIEWITTP